MISLGTNWMYCESDISQNVINYLTISPYFNWGTTIFFWKEGRKRKEKPKQPNNNNKKTLTKTYVVLRSCLRRSFIHAVLGLQNGSNLEISSQAKIKLCLPLQDPD